MSPSKSASANRRPLPATNSPASRPLTPAAGNARAAVNRPLPSPSMNWIIREHADIRRDRARLNNPDDDVGVAVTVHLGHADALGAPAIAA